MSLNEADEEEVRCGRVFFVYSNARIVQEWILLLRYERSDLLTPSSLLL